MNALLLAPLLLGTLTEANAQSTAAPRAARCEKVRLGALVGKAGPGVLFLGERRGVRRDLVRARRIVKRLAASGPVTVAIEVIPGSRNDVLERLQLGRVPFDRVQEALAWSETVGFDFTHYGRILSLYRQPNVSVGAVGQPVALRPEETTVALPPGYGSVLSDTMGDGPMPDQLEGRFVQTVAYHDQRVAQAALDQWNGQGWLVVLVDRAWLAGGLGMQWQAARLTQAPVRAVLLADAGSRCYPGDQVL